MGSFSWVCVSNQLLKERGLEQSVARSCFQLLLGRRLRQLRKEEKGAQERRRTQGRKKKLQTDWMLPERG